MSVALSNDSTIGQAESQVRHEMGVHDIDVKPVGTGDGLRLVGETSEIGGQNRRGNHRVGHIDRV